MQSDLVASNLAAVEERIAAACIRAGRPRGEVTLIAVSKTFGADSIDAAVAAGVTDCGENRVQELRDKIEAVHVTPRFHLIGHLQSNKVKDAVRLFDVIHTVDSLELGQKIARAALAAAKPVEILLQINVGEEPQKSGVAATDARALAAQINALDGVTLRGLMAIPPAGTAEEAREHFRSLRLLRDELRAELGERFSELSMGMSEDFEAAIEEGATMIRIGRAIFGSRGMTA